MANIITIRQGQSVSLLLTLDTAPSAPVYVGIYPNAVRASRILLSTADGSLTPASDTVYSASITPQQSRQMSGEYILEVLIGNPTGNLVAISHEPVTLRVLPSRIGKEVVQ